MAIFICLLLAVASLVSVRGACPSAPQICIVGSGISGSAAAYFVRNYSAHDMDIHVFEQSSQVGGRMAMLEMGESKFEAGASILHPKNLHAAYFTEILGFEKRQLADDDDSNFGIWNGSAFIFMTQRPTAATSYLSRTWTQILNKLVLFWRYKLSLVYMNAYVSVTLAKFMRYYDKSKPVFHTVEEMLRWADLYESTQITSEAELRRHGLSQELIDELVTVIMRINYGQSKSISGMAGAVSLCGAGENFWAVEGGNWQMAAGLLQITNASIHLDKKVNAVISVDDGYEVSITLGERKFCDAVIVAASLDESQIEFRPPLAIPKRHMQHTHATFVRGIINPDYFGMPSVTSVPNLIGTVEASSIPFSSINILKSYGDDDKAYKVFSRTKLSNDLLDLLFWTRKKTVHLDWAAYPHYSAPERFAPFVLDGKHLYYINAFENAASTMETGAVAAENVVRLLLSRMCGGVLRSQTLDCEQGMLETDL